MIHFAVILFLQYKMTLRLDMDSLSEQIDGNLLSGDWFFMIVIYMSASCHFAAEQGDVPVEEAARQCTIITLMK